MKQIAYIKIQRQKTQRKNRLLNAFCSIALLAMAAVAPVASANVLISDIGFPDTNFSDCVNAAAVAAGISYSDDLLSLDCTEKNITSVAGLEQLTALTSLTLTNNWGLSSVDLSGNTALESFIMVGINSSSLSLSSLNIQNNGALKTLIISGSPLGSVDLSANPALEILWLPGCQLTDINLTNNPALSSLWLNGNQLTDINLDNNNALSYVNLTTNPLSLDPAVASYLLGLNIPAQNFATPVTALNFSSTALFNCVKDESTAQGVVYAYELQTLDCTNKGISTVTDIDQLRALTSLDLSRNLGLSSVDLSGNTALESFVMVGDGSSSLSLSNLNIQNNAALRLLIVSASQLGSFDLSANPALEFVWLPGCQLTDINLTNNPVLSTLLLNDNQLTSINLDNNNALTNVNLMDNPLSSDLDVALYLLDRNIPVQSFAAPVLDFNFPDAQFHQCIANHVNYFNLFYAHEIPVLNCAVQTNIQSIQSVKGIELFTNLTYLSFGDDLFTNINLSYQTALTTLYLNNSQLTDIDLSQNTALTSLELNSNSLTSLDLSNNIALETVSVDANQLSALDLSVNTLLENLTASGNQLTDIALDNNTALISVDLSSNPLSADAVSRLLAQNIATVIIPSLADIHFVDAAFEQCVQATSVGDPQQLLDLDCNNQGIQSVQGIEIFTALTSLNLSGNALSSLDLSSSPALAHLTLDNMALTSLDLSQNTLLEDASLQDNQLSSINTGSSELLWYLNLANNLLTDINLNPHTGLTQLYLSDNQLTDIYLDYNITLDTVDLLNNPLSTEVVNELSGLIIPTLLLPPPDSAALTPVPAIAVDIFTNPMPGESVGQEPGLVVLSQALTDDVRVQQKDNGDQMICYTTDGTMPGYEDTAQGLNCVSYPSNTTFSYDQSAVITCDDATQTVTKTLTVLYLWDDVGSVEEQLLSVAYDIECFVRQYEYSIISSGYWWGEKKSGPVDIVNASYQVPPVLYLGDIKNPLPDDSTESIYEPGTALLTTYTQSHMYEGGGHHVIDFTTMEKTELRGSWDPLFDLFYVESVRSLIYDCINEGFIDVCKFVDQWEWVDITYTLTVNPIQFYNGREVQAYVSFTGSMVTPLGSFESVSGYELTTTASQ